MNLYKTSERLVSHNYPYGYLRTDKFDWIEFKSNKGFRHMSMTINPKTGRENKPKAGVYQDIIVLGKDPSNDYTHSMVFSFYHDEDFNKIAEFMFNHFDLFTPEQIIYVYMKYITHAKTTIYAQCVYCGSKAEDLLPLFKPMMDICFQGLKDKGLINHFGKINLDCAKVASFKVPNYQPFTSKYYTIGAKGLVEDKGEAI